jgi:hypothetical protein
LGKSSAPKPAAPKKAAGPGGSLAGLERIGKKVPHPAIIFLWLIGIGIVIALIDIILTGPLPRWAILAPILLPPFMRLGGDPNLVLAGYRVGESRMSVNSAAERRSGSHGRFCAEVSEGCGNRHDCRADVALNADAAGALDGASHRLVSVRHPSWPCLIQRT